jgi:hypothetical protein
LQVARVEEIVFDGVARARDVRVLEATDAAHELVLHVERQAGRDSRSDRTSCVSRPSGSMKIWCESLSAKAHDLVFDGRAVTRSHAFDHTGEHRRAVRAGADEFVRALVGRRDVTAHLGRMFVTAAEVRKYRHGFIAGLHLQRGVSR